MFRDKSRIFLEVVSAGSATVTMARSQRLSL